jgi:hypothetical protein
VKNLKFLVLVLFLVKLPAVKAQTFYDINTIQRIEISFFQSNWDNILDTAKAGADGYLLSQWVKINGVQFDSAGVKYKGNSSYNANNVKNPLHIELDHFKEQDYQGFKDIKLSNGYNEPSFIREVMLYSIFQNYSEASRANYAQVVINGQYMGVYTNVEAVTKTFLSDRFSSDNNTFVFADNGGCNLKYKGADSTLYYTPYTLKSDAGWTHLMQLCDTLKNKITAIENTLDVDRTLWWLAYTNAFVTLDSYLGNGTHNYYMYRDHNKRFNPIIWDLNGGIGIFSKANMGPPLSLTQMENLSPMLHANDTMWPLMKNLMAIPMYKRMYIAHMKTIMNENVASGTYSTYAQSLQSIADTAVFSDPNKFCTYTQYQANLTTTVVLGPKTVPGIFPFMNARLSYLNSTPEFMSTAPTITNVLPSNATPSLNTSVFITADISNATAVFVGYRYSPLERFRRIPMLDDGLNGDGSPSDGNYGIAVPVNSLQVQYYIYAENNNAGMFSPQRAEHEYHILNALGSPTVGQIFINEFLADNVGDVSNELFQYEDWIELYNATSATLNLGGSFLTDNFSSPTKFQIPDGTVIPPYSYLIVWADENPSTTSYVHCNFKLSAAGEQLMLRNANGAVLDSITFGAQTTDKSMARCPDGVGTFTTAAFPTFKLSNCAIGVNELNSDKSMIRIFPNPAHNYFVIRSSGKEAGELVVSNTLGEEMYKAKFTKEISVNTTGWEPGMYFVRSQNSTKKLIVTH